jgi:hypothetical protein
MRPAALRVSPADDDEFFAVQAFGLQPRTAAIAGSIRCIDGLRHDALGLQPARLTQEGGAIAHDVIAVLQPGRRAFQDIGQPRLALEERLEEQILAIVVEQIERGIDEPFALCLRGCCIRLNDVVPSGRTAQSSHRGRPARPVTLLATLQARNICSSSPGRIAQ